MKKRIISLLLTVAILISTLPIIASADAAEAEASLKSVSLTLDGILSLNVKVDPGSVSDMSGYKVKFTVGEETPWECTEPTYNESTNLYVYTAKIPAHKLHNSVKVELLNANSEAVDESGWTLDAYLAYQVDRDPGLSDLAYALGLYADNAEAYKTGADSTPPETDVEQAALEAYKCESVIAGDVIPSAVLLLNDACTLRVQISADKWADGYSLLIDGEAKELAHDETEGIYYYDIKDIRAQDWDKKYVVEIADSTSTIFKCNYAVLSYVYTVLGAPESYAKELNLLKSMYLYSQGADDYIAAERFDYSLTYNANYEGSEETKVESATITATSKNYTVCGNPFYRPGYRFAGWNTAADGTGTSYDVGSTLTLNAVNTLINEDFNAFSDAWKAYENGVESTNYWSVADGAVRHNNPNKSTTDISVLMLDTAVNVNSYEITANLVLPKSNCSVGLVFADNQFFRIWNNGSGSFKVYVGSDANNANSNYSGLGGISIGLNSGQAVTVKVIVDGNQFSIIVNDTLITQTPVTANKDQLTGKIGLYVRAGGNDTVAAFNDVKVSAAKTTESLYAQWEEIVLFSEDFNDSIVSDTWTQYDNGAAATENVWSAADGTMKYTGSSTANSGLLFDTAINADSYEITAQVMMPSAGSIGLVFAASDDGMDLHYFRIFVSGDTYKLYAGHNTDGFASTKTYSTANGVQRGSDWSDVRKGLSVTLKVKVEGNNFAIYANEHEWVSCTADNNLHGKVGLFLRNGSGATDHSFDDVNVSVPNILVSENFNNKEVFSGWMQYDNNVATSEDVWSAADGKMKYSGSTTQNSVLLFDTEIREDNYEFATQVVMPASGSIGLVFAANDDLSDFHYFRIWTSGSNDYMSAGYDHEDVLETLNSAFASSANKSCSDIAANKSVVLKVVVNGQNFSIYAGSTLLLSGTTERENLHGKVGLFLRNVVGVEHSFDDVLVVKTEAAATE